MSTSTTVPICTRGPLTATLTLPWFVDHAEYATHNSSLQILVNGEQTFATLHETMARAKRTISIICWGFQPSMYLVRNGHHQVSYVIDGKTEVFPVQLGKLLEHKAAQGVTVRVRCFAATPLNMKVNVTGHQDAVGESNTPGRWIVRIKDRPPYEVEDAPPSDPDRRGQYQYDQDWYYRYDDQAPGLYADDKDVRKRKGDVRAQHLHFYSRGFSAKERARIASMPHDDRGLSWETTKQSLPGGPSHHQKSVLVDYDDAQHARALVMGHNLLDEYWDSDAHPYRVRKPWLGRNGSVGPREDFSALLSGSIVGDVFYNFAAAWKQESGEQLPDSTFCDYPYFFKRGSNDALRFMIPCPVQLVRTQAQAKPMVQDIKRAYYQAVNNVTSYIFIENQYFRFPPLADKIKAAARAQQQARRQAPIYLFVITNSTDDGVGKGSVNTYRMLAALGRRDTMPGVSKAYEMDDAQARLGQAEQKMKLARLVLNNPVLYPKNEPASQALIKTQLQQAKAEYQQAQASYEQRKAEAEAIAKGQDVDIPTVDIPGLKTLICTLVAPDSPAGDWRETYIHAKLMLVNDCFTTLGSANINTRSMEVDSELNLLTNHSDIARALRRKLWGMHTSRPTGLGSSDSPELAQARNKANPEGMGRFEPAYQAHEAWQKIINANKFAEQNKRPPIAALRGMLRRSAERSNSD
ncbi:phospholipase D-like domain-containing protein [Aquitalea denitrificans]|uniref:phospholipase D-like domain-containing protein n=1 Tax=Aquitalea denitrificans TaxID=519081 RepID=UPI00135BDABC|nr:phospholipase D-like domain-containing protein [Aquitalea denitrificans]